MALNHLTIAEMVSSTEGWTQVGNPARDAFMRMPSLAALMPKIEEAMNGLIGIQRVTLDQFVKQLKGRRKGADFRHDSFSRAAYYTLEAHIHLARANDDDDTESALLVLRDLLFPFGLEIVKFSYVEEAGQARLMESRITTENEERLATIPVADENLLDIVRKWLNAGAELGQLETELADTQLPSQRGPVAEARRRWARVVKAVRTVADLESSLDPTIERALHQVAMAEAAALRRLRESEALDASQSDGDAGMDDGDAGMDDGPAPVAQDGDAGTDDGPAPVAQDGDAGTDDGPTPTEAPIEAAETPSGDEPDDEAGNSSFSTTIAQ